jgi:hypothetical protein
MELTAKEKWIIDGNHTDTMELRFKAADIVIYLHKPFFVIDSRRKINMLLIQWRDEKTAKGCLRH